MSAATVWKSICAGCGGPIVHGVTAGSGFDTKVWTHVDVEDWEHDVHQAVPETRFAIDATCGGCDFPEIGFAPARQEYVCSRCGWTSDRRPSS